MINIDKKGFIRTLEAVIAIILLLGLVLYTYNINPKTRIKTPLIIESTNNFIINEFLNNEEYRYCFSNTDLEGTCDFSLTNPSVIKINNKNCNDIIKNFVTKALPPGYSYACEVCKTSKSCSNVNSPKEKSVYPKSGLIYSAVKSEGRIIRIYLY